jgi:hypothetical protein
MSKHIFNNCTISAEKISIGHKTGWRFNPFLPVETTNVLCDVKFNNEVGHNCGYWFYVT